MIWVLFVILNLIISIWNAYISGFNIELIRQVESQPQGVITRGISPLIKIACYCGLLLAFSGTTYAIAIIIGYGALYFEYVSTNVVEILFAYNYLVFGGLITMLGIVITIESVVVAIKTKNKWHILISGWNIFASTWNIIHYISNFGIVKGMLESDSSDSDDTKDRAIILLLVAVMISIVIVYATFKVGQKKARSEV